MEGMRGLVARHGPALDPARTRVVVLETLGSPGADPARGRGDDLDDRLRRRRARLDRRLPRERAGDPLRRGLRLGFATDALSALRAGLPAATLASCDEYKMPSNYHSQRDIPRNVDFGTVARAPCVVAEAAIRSAASARALIASSRVRDLARVARLLELRRAAGRARARARSPARAPARRRAPAAAARRAARRSSAGPSISRASSRWAAIAGSALRPRVASRSATVKTVTSARVGLGRAAGSARSRAATAAARGRGSRAAGGAA